MTPLKHIAIIMDGNGRWAKMRSHPRVWGHIRGSNTVSDIVEAASDIGIQALTLYAFSSENWCRPQLEIKVLFRLLHKFLQKEKNRILKNQIRFKVIGDISNLPISTKKLISDLELQTVNMKGLKLTFAFGYGGRNEIVQAMNQFIKDHPSEEVTEKTLAQYMALPDLGDVDLLIRTGGDQRVSNFLLWQIAYAELFFTETKWPDFTDTEFKKIIETVSLRERRFGSDLPQNGLDTSVQQAQVNKSALGS
jgi:undecaprenyl diphosphate synthase